MEKTNGVYVPAGAIPTKSSGGFFMPLDGTAAVTCAETLESSLRTHVVTALQKTLSAHPEKPLSMMIESLRDGNPMTDTKTIQLPKVVECVSDAALTSLKHKKRSHRLVSREPGFPLHVELDASVGDIITTIGESKARFEALLQKDAQAVMCGDMGYASRMMVRGVLTDAELGSTGPSGAAGIVGAALSKEANDATDYGREAASHLPSTADCVQVFVVTPLGREVVFLDGAPYVGNVALRRAARDLGPGLAAAAAAAAEANKKKGGHKGAGGGGDDDDEKWSDSGSDDSSVLMDDGAAEVAEDIEQEICDVVTTNQLARRCISVAGLRSEITRMFSKTAPNLRIELCRLVVPADRLQLQPRIIDEIDEALGTSADAGLVPTVVFPIGFAAADLVVRNVVAAIATVIGQHVETKRLQVNALVEVVHTEKKRIRIEKMASGTQISVNPSGYWMKVRERREARDRRREAKLVEIKKRTPVMPMPSNVSDYDRAVLEAQRARDAEQREAYLKGLEQRLNEASLRRQARRSKEDMDAAAAITNTFAEGAVIVQCIIRGFLTRQRLQKKNLLSKQLQRQVAAASSPTTRAAIIERYARHAHEGSTRNRITSTVPWAIERDVLAGLTHEYPQALTSLAPRGAVNPRLYRSWLPVRHPVPRPHEDDVSSEEEEWISTQRTVHPKPQTARFRLVNPYAKAQATLIASRCDLDSIIQSSLQHFAKVSPLQRRAFAAIQAKCMHVLHTAFLDLRARDALPRDPPPSYFSDPPLTTTQTILGMSTGVSAGGSLGRGSSPSPRTKLAGSWTFSAFLAQHKSELDSWFNMPHFVSRCLHELALKHGIPGSVPHLLPPPPPAPAVIPPAPQMAVFTASPAASSVDVLVAPAAQPAVAARPRECEVPLLSTHFVAFEDLHAGHHWASMAESQVISSGKLTSGAIWKYLRDAGVVQLGPTRVFLVSDTMKTSQIQAALQALNESLKCTKLRWMHTSPFPTAFVYDRAVFACMYSEHLAKNTSVAANNNNNNNNYGGSGSNGESKKIFRSVSEAMLEGKLNPAAAEAKAKATAERLLHEKMAAMADRSAAGGGTAGGGNLAGGGSTSNLPSATATRTSHGPGGRPSNARTGFVGRTVGTRARAGTQQPTTSPTAAFGGGDSINPTPDPATARHRPSIADTIADSEASLPATGGAFASLGSKMVSAVSAASSAGNKLSNNSNAAEELNTHAHLDPVNINDKLTAHPKLFNGISGGSSPSGHASRSATAMSSFANQQQQQQHRDGSDGPPAREATVNNFAGLEAQHLMSVKTLSSSSLLKSEHTWFGASWLDLDTRFTEELIAHVRAESGALTVMVPQRGFEDPTPKMVEEPAGKAAGTAAAADEGAEAGAGAADEQHTEHGGGGSRGGSPSRPSLKGTAPAAPGGRLSRGSTQGRLRGSSSAQGGASEAAGSSTATATAGAAAGGGGGPRRSGEEGTGTGITPKSSFGGNGSPKAAKKGPSGLQLLLGRFPTRLADSREPDVRSFRCLAARPIKIIVTIPLKKVNSMSMAGNNGMMMMNSGIGGVDRTLGVNSARSGLIAQVSHNLGASANPGMTRGVSVVAGIRVGGSDSRGPRSQSRMVRSMSRVTVAMPGGGSISALSSSAKQRQSGAVESDEERADAETPPPLASDLIATPEATFAKLFMSFPFVDPAFVRFPALSLGGQSWIDFVALIVRDTYLHMQRGGAEEVCTVVSVSTSDDIFYALLVALVHAILFLPETLGSKARKAAAAHVAAAGGAGAPGAAATAAGAGSPRTRFAPDVSSGTLSGTTRGGGDGNGSSSSINNASGSPSKSDNISRLSTGLDKKASRRFNAPPRPPPADTEDFTLPPTTPEEQETFHCIRKYIDTHEVDSLDLSYAAMELDCMIHKCGLWTTFKMPVIMARQKAETMRGTLDSRQWVREACCGLERYLWLLVIVRCLMDYRQSNPRKFNDGDADARASLSVQKNAEAPLLMEFIQRRLGMSFFRFLYKGIDPWQQRPKLSPDPTHMHTYSMFPQRWFRPYFTPSVV